MVEHPFEARRTVVRFYIFTLAVGEIGKRSDLKHRSLRVRLPYRLQVISSTDRMTVFETVDEGAIPS
jgi:hypothetical protein